MRVLICVAHPDDEVLAFGGLVSKFSKEHTFRIIYLAEGISPRLAGKQPTAEQLSHRNQGSKFLLRFGLSDMHFLDTKCGNLHLENPVTYHDFIRKHIQDFGPQLICTTSQNDNHVDHRTCFELVMVAARPIEEVAKISIIVGEVLSSTEWRFSEVFQPNLFLELDAVNLDHKKAMMRAYETEIRPYPFPRSDIGIETLARFRGIKSGNEFAEAYSLIRGVVQLH